MLKNFLHKRRSITAQTSILITLTIAVALVISALLFYYKTDKELTTHYREQMFQESNTTMNVLSDNIDTIDSIYRLLVSSDTIYSFMASSFGKRVIWSLFTFILIIISDFMCPKTII